jgi:hypothetical protein
MMLFYATYTKQFPLGGPDCRVIRNTRVRITGLPGNPEHHRVRITGLTGNPEHHRIQITGLPVSVTP